MGKSSKLEIISMRFENELTLSSLREHTGSNATDVFFANAVVAYLRSQCWHTEHMEVTQIGKAHQSVLRVIFRANAGEVRQRHLSYSTAFMGCQLKLGLRAYFRQHENLHKAKERLFTSNPIFTAPVYLVVNIPTLNCSSETIRTEWLPCMSGALARSLETSYGSGRGFPRPSSTAMDTTGALCISWISFPSRASTLCSENFSSEGTSRAYAYTEPEFVPAHIVGP